ncbi:MAG TPA: hypothetical protein PLO44_00350 [Candidatus Paceibacterota bacterium]|nr:hypothetical protein [Candidatus Paceibacterota bacterium]
MHINSKIEKKYQEMKKSNKTEDFLDEKFFKGLKIFINKQPKTTLFTLEFEPDIVYLGSD